jgi:hypothetical protein
MNISNKTPLLTLLTPNSSPGDRSWTTFTKKTTNIQESPRRNRTVSRKKYKPTFTHRRRPDWEALKAQRVYLRPFDPAPARGTFVRWCQAHLMNSQDLNHVLATTHLESPQTTLFLMGERHAAHTKCSGTLDFFKKLCTYNESLAKPLLIDVLIEHKQYDSYARSRPVDEYSDAQINLVRNYFQVCIQKRNCPVRVHWADPTLFCHKPMPEWLFEMVNSGELMSGSWTQNPLITQVFKNEGDLPKLLTGNPYVVKEIDKASKINPKFTLTFATNLFQSLFYEMDHDWPVAAKLMLRHTVDFYTAARIVKAQMKHVLYYAGLSHTDAVEKILTALDFQLVEKKEKKGFCSL